MKQAIAFLIFGALQPVLSGATTPDPVQDYLASALSNNGYLGEFYSDDVLCRLDIDLNRDGSPEVLLSLGRDSLGREGNTWAVYKVARGGFERVGEVIFGAPRFYLGHIDEIHRYGIVSFFPAGGGEGILYACTFDGRGITRTEIGRVERDIKTLELKGEGLVEKYYGERANGREKMLVTIAASEFGPKYHLEINPMKYHDYVISHLAAWAEAEAKKKSLVKEASGADNMPEPDRRASPGDFTRDLAEKSSDAQTISPVGP